MKPFTLKFFDQNERASFAQAVEIASNQKQVELRTPGSLVHEKRRGNKTFVYWHRYSVEGKLEKEYVGPSHKSEETEARSEHQDLLLLRDTSKKLRKLGFLATDTDTAITLAAFFNAGIFNHGGVMVGTHAYAALLNSLGARVLPHSATEDLDIAARLQMAIPQRPSIFEILQETGLPFLEVPSLNRKSPSTAFKVRGRALKVDLLVPAKNDSAKPVFIRSLGAYATGLPHLDYLVNKSVLSLVIAKDRLVPVTVPQAGRFCVHKLAVSTLRGSASAKSGKDIFQAAIIAVVLSQTREFEMEEAIDDASRALLKKAKPAVSQALKLLEDRYPDAAQLLSQMI